MNTQTEDKQGWRMLATASLFLVLTAFLGDHAIGQLVSETPENLMPVSSTATTPLECA